MTGSFAAVGGVGPAKLTGSTTVELATAEALVIGSDELRLVKTGTTDARPELVPLDPNRLPTLPLPPGVPAIVDVVIGATLWPVML